MRIGLDSTGVAELVRRFGDLHDSVIRRFSGTFTAPARIEIEIEALAVNGVWWRLTLVVSDVSEFRLAEGVAVWGNETSWEVTTHHPDGTSTQETRPRDLANLRLRGPTHQVIFGAAIYTHPEGIFVDLAPSDLASPSESTDPAAWRTSTFYVFGRSGEARIEPLEDAQPRIRAEFLGDGAVTMFFRRELFDATVSRLTNAGYRVHVIDASSYDIFRRRMTHVMGFKENFGYEPWTGNLAALNDAFREVDYTSVTGVVLAFLRFDLLHQEDPHTAHHVLDILENASRSALLVGRDLIGLVQSDDPNFALRAVGAKTPRWNRAEWMNSKRGGA